MPTTTYTLHRESGPIDLDIEYSWEGASRGYRDMYGQWEPDESAFVMIESWTPEIDLTDDELAEIEAAIWEEHES